MPVTWVMMVTINSSSATLFMVGIMYTMGRVNRAENRAFLELCEKKGWLNIFSDPTASAERWLGVIDQFFEDQIDDNRFLHWMRQYVSIRGIARSLRDYVDLFLDIDRQGRHFALSRLTRPRSDPSQQGGGIDAAAIPRVLGIGACFIVRELTRSGVLKKPWSVPHCYVPELRVRRLLAELRCLDLGDVELANADLSRKIHDELVKNMGEERAVFNNGFDLPLLAVAEREELQLRFLGHTLG